MYLMIVLQSLPPEKRNRPLRFPSEVIGCHHAGVHHV